MGKGFQRSGKSQGNLLCGKLIGRILSRQLREMVTHTFHFHKWKICGQAARFPSPFQQLHRDDKNVYWGLLS